MPGYETDTVTRIETNLDDLPPQVLGSVMQQLLAAGALDVWFTPVQMKKNRPGVMLSALCHEEKVPPLADIIFTETTAFGLRVEKIQRLKLSRRFESVRTPHGEVTVKRLRRGKEGLALLPRNPDYAPIVVPPDADFAIEGLYCGLVRPSR